MRITKFKIKNYVSYYAEVDQTEWVDLGHGINIVLGANNAGKTALLDALSRAKSRAPHRSVSTIPTPDSRETRRIELDFEYEFQKNELLKILRDHGQTSFIQFFGVDSGRESDRVQTLKKMLSDETHLRFFSSPYEIQIGEHKESLEILDTMELPYYKFSLLENEKFDIECAESKTHLRSGEETWWETIQRYVFENVFKFQAERHIPAHADVAKTLELKSDASNLPQVLFTLQECDSSLLNDFTQLIRLVFPDVRRISTRRISQLSDEDDYLEIYIGYDGVPADRDDLDIPLVGCGSGLTQVMAILSVIVTAVNDRVFLIDEPSTFLHPEATRNLFSVLEKFPRHQYIIATHSPMAIASVREKTILHVERTGMRSRVRALNANDTRALGETYRSLGMRPSDILGIDAIVWVEGPTERRCYPLILETAGYQLESVRFIPIAEIGDTTGKSAKKFIAILEAVAKDVGLLPREVICVHDGDKATNLVNANTERDVRIETIARQNYESYLIVASAVTRILKEDDPDNADEYTVEGIQDWIDKNYNSDDYYPKKQFESETWQYCINGAKFVGDLFDRISGHRVVYDKIDHTPRLTKLVLDECPDHFQEIVDQIQSILDKSKTPDSA